ncbi:hypothetical protein AB0D99_31890 [Streptomyces sp. NPDC047971]|uniref:hypothetical protein n=1 Tax=Streptomyces sp. NPDC047971 TaxID=3154499 RepID=UPI0033FDB0F0
MTYTGWAAGSRITTTRLNEISGIWIPYTMSWTGTTTNPAIGNGIIEAEYALVGGLCTVRGNVTMGSTTTYGSGQFQFSIPFMAATLGHADNHWVGSATSIDRGAAWFPGQCRVASGTNYAQCISSTTAGGGTPTEWNPTRPFTWANTDNLSFTVTYEPA